MRRQTVPRFLLFTVLLFVGVFTFATVADRPFQALAQSVGAGERSYIVIMHDDPVIVYEGDVPGYEATKPGRGKKINPNSAHAKKYAGYLKTKHNNALSSAGVPASKVTYDYYYAVSGFAARLSEAEAAALRAQAGVRMVVPDQLRKLHTDASPKFLGLTDPAGPWSKGFTGEGVVVGVIDTGIWPEHPSFADDGSYGPPPASFTGTGCDFGNTAFNPDDDPFTCNNKLLAAKKYNEAFKDFLTANGSAFTPGTYDSARDEEGHGSHTSSTAAGNAGVSAEILGMSLGKVSGIAPRARISMYKACWTSPIEDGCFASDLVAAIDQAVADGVDVINYSIGGAASLTGPDDLAFLFAADAGVFVAASAGNSGPGPNTIGGPASVPWLTAVGANTHNRTFQGAVMLGDGQKFFGASITPGVGPAPLVDAEFHGGEFCIPGTLTTVTGKIVLCRRGVVARVDKSRAVAEAGGIGMILYNTSATEDLLTDNHFVPTVHVNDTAGAAIKTYISTAGASATAIIEGGKSIPSPGSVMAAFSSRGPNPVAPDIIKPDVTAPGVQILAGNTPTPLFSAPGQLFQAIAGTSMSSPHVAGTFALIKQAHPGWSPAMVKSALMTTARQNVVKEDGSTPADPFDMGAGHIAPGGKAIKGSVFQPGLVYDAGLLDYLGFLCDAKPDVFSDPAATCSSLDAIGVPTTATDLNLASIGVANVTGPTVVRRRVTSVAEENGWRTYDVWVNPPPGFNVEVSPASIQLKKGQSATYEILITPNGAPAGEWRFGSLTWREKTGQYNVYSRMAVRRMP
ncbi:MAG: S8 family serine peptidase [Deltaproteobacteria bacterium]|nr:S8 family serine peptidase [Deltaproteobacteria bacterium]